MLLPPYLSPSPPTLGGWGRCHPASLPREQSPLSLFLSASALATIPNLPQEGHSSPLCPTTLPQQPCSCGQANTCPLCTEDPVVKGFLEWDRSLRLTDKVPGTPAPPLILGQRDFLSPQFPVQPDALSPLPFRDPGVSCSVDGSPASGLAPVASEPKACPCGCWHIMSPVLSALGDSLSLQLIRDPVMLAVLHTRPETLSACHPGDTSRSLVPLFFPFHHVSPLVCSSPLSTSTCWRWSSLTSAARASSAGSTRDFTSSWPCECCAEAHQSAFVLWGVRGEEWAPDLYSVLPTISTVYCVYTCDRTSIVFIILFFVKANNPNAS